MREGIISLPEPKVITEQLTHLKLLLVYHATFGNLEESARIARRFLNFEGALSAHEKLDLIRKAGIALWLAGFTDEALVAVIEANALARAAGLRRVEFALTLMCASVFSDIRDDTASEAWRIKAERIGDEVPSFRENQHYIVIASELAVGAWNLPEIRSWYSMALSTPGITTNRRGRRWVYALEVLDKHVSGTFIDVPAVIDELAAAHRGGDNGQIADFEMAAALRIAVGTEHQAHAEMRLNEYLTRHRHGRQPLSRPLYEAMIRAEVKPPTEPTMAQSVARKMEVAGL